MEVPLVARELEAVDGQLASAEHTLFWHHEGINPSLLGRPKPETLLVCFGGVPVPQLTPHPVTALGSPQPSHPKRGPPPRRRGWVGG